jgi:hypothetical protein
MNWRKWIRILHRDIGYIATGLTVIYAVSGIAVNHVDEWNPNYIIEKSTVNITPPDSAFAESDSVETYILNKLGETGKYKNSFRPDEESIQIFVEGNTITANLKTGEVEQEKVKSRTGLRESNFLHLNQHKKAWTYIADVFAVALIFLAISGLFMIKGKKGITGRGAWLTGLGFLIPIIYLLIYYYGVFK